MVICFIFASYSGNYTLFLATTFCIGTSMGGLVRTDCLFLLNSLFEAKFTLPFEIVDSKHRSYVPPIFGILWLTGSVMYLVTSWYFRDWKLSMIANFSTILVATLTYYSLLPESPRWLMKQGRNSECVDQLNTIGRVNKRELSDGTVDELLKVSHSKSTQNTFILLLQHKTVLFRFCVIAFAQWVFLLFTMTYFVAFFMFNCGCW